MGYIASDGKMDVNNELKRIRKGAAMVSIKVLSQHMPGGMTKREQKTHSG
jgi:hypothetical protein